MTGMFVRVQRSGRWESAELDRLTDQELEAWAARLRESSPFDGYRWAVALAKFIRDRAAPSPAAAPAIDVEAAARVDLFVREVDRGIDSMPARFADEARAELVRVIAEARRLLVAAQASAADLAARRGGAQTERARGGMPIPPSGGSHDGQSTQAEGCAGGAADEPTRDVRDQHRE